MTWVTSIKSTNARLAPKIEHVSNRERNRAKTAIPTAAMVRGSNGSIRDLSGSSLD
jgi:hypothetical protein